MQNKKIKEILQEIIFLKKEIKKLKTKKRKIINFIKTTEQKYSLGVISKKELEQRLSFLRGKTKQEITAEIEKEIEKLRKKIEKNYKKAALLYKEEKEKKKKIKKNLSILVLIVFFVFFLFFLLKIPFPRLTGFFILEQERTYKDVLNLEFNTSHQYEWKPQHYGKLTSVKVSGKLIIREEGFVKIYLEDKLILDSSKLEAKRSTSRASLITGSTIEGFGASESNEEKLELVESFEQSESPSEEIIEQTQPESEEPIEEKKISEENITGEKTEEELAETAYEIDFSQVCLETCDLEDLNFTSKTYTLHIEIRDAYLRIDSITYSILPTERTNHPPELIKEIPDQEIFVNSSKVLNLSEFFFDPDDDSLEFNFTTDNENLTSISIDKNFLTITSYDLTGTQRIVIYASDGNLITASNEFIVNVTTGAEIINLTNNPPLLIQNIPNITISENGKYTFDLAEYFIDLDGDILTFNSTQPENITLVIEGSLVILIPEINFTGTREIIFYASDGNFTTESNLVYVHVIENISFELVGKEFFSWREEPEFELREKNPKNKTKNKETIKANKKFSYAGEILELELYNNEELQDGDIEIEKTGDEFKIKLPRKKEFRPGKYILKANYTKNGQKFFLEKYFYWGVLAINTHKSIYFPNETANISIGVLDLAGRVFCYANVTLEITDPSNKKTILTTEKEIKRSKECETQGFTYVPDYSTTYQTNGPGIYHMKLTATTYDGTYSIEDEFLVQETSFDVFRQSATRINPTYEYEMNITIKAAKNYRGTIIEKVPSSFEIKSVNENGKIKTSNNIKKIEWQVNLKKGDLITLTYKFDAPDVWPMIFLAGPLQIGSWQEAREWQILSDTPANLILLWDDPTSDAPSGWTCISCSSGQNFYGRFIRGYSSYGSTQGGSPTHSHSDPGTLTSTQASAAQGGTGTTNTRPPLSTHTHTATVLSGLSADNLPAFRNLKVIRYNNGIPETLPAGVIAIFSGPPPPGWTNVYNDGRYIRGDDTANVGKTGGSNTHTHTITLSLSSNSAASSSRIGSGTTTIGAVVHNHTTNPATSVANTSEPPYITVILAKKDSPGPIPVGMIGMFDATPPNQWTVLSNGGGPFNQRFFKPTGVYGTTGGASSHTHSPLVMTTNGPSSTITTTTGTTFSSGTHTHDFTVTFDEQSHVPVYWDVIFASATSTPSPILEQIHYHWRNDDGNEISATSATSGFEDTKLTDAFTSNKRLRIEISNEGWAAAENYRYRLEYGLKETTCSAISNWVDVGAPGGDWDMYDSPNLNDGEDTTNIPVPTGGVTDENIIFKAPNKGVKDISSTLVPITLTYENFLEMEFSIIPNVQSGDYCFRITNAGDTSNFVYTRYAEATVDQVAPIVLETRVNVTEVYTNELICVNANINEIGTGINKAWVYITYPNGTQLNYSSITEMKDQGTTSCDGSEGDNIYGVEINVGSTPGTFYVNYTYANDSVGNLGHETLPPLEVKVITAAQAPTIYDISDIPDQSITEASVTNVEFFVIVSDAQGYNTIDNVNATFYREGESLRYNSSCVFVNAINSTTANYSCTIGIWYWDAPGTWQVNATANDTSGLVSEPYNESFLLMETAAFVVSPLLLTFPTVAPGSKNVTSNNDPSLLNNTGNANINTIQIKALNLVGETNPSYYIPAANFTADIETGGSPPAECEGTNLQHNVFVAISGATLPRGNNSAGQGQEQIYYCLREVPSNLISQTYSTSSLGPWIIKIVISAALILPAKRRKKKKTYEKDRLFDVLKLVVGEIKEKYNLSVREILETIEKAAEEKEEKIPVTIFKEDLAPLECVVKYLKENLNLKFSEIAKLLNRDDRTIWVTYNNALKKKKEKLKAEETKILIPISIFRSRKLSILEALVCYLKDKNFSYSEIAKLLGRDPRNVWTVSSRAKRKLKNI